MRLPFCAVLTALLGVGATCSHAELIYGLTNFQQLDTFDSETRVVTSSVPLTGFGISGPFLVSIDSRPATGELYGLSNTNNIFKINPVTGTSTLITPTPLTLNGNAKAIDFNPTVDRIRVLTSGDDNQRVHPDTGALVATDASLGFAAGDSNAGDNATVVNGAYTNSVAGATNTTLFDLDAFNDILAMQVPPNDGSLNTVGVLGFDIVDSGGFTGFDISGATGTAYLTGGNFFGSPALTAGSLYSVNLATGAASLLGPVTGAGTYRDIAVAIAAVPEPSAFLLGICGAAALVLRRRK